MHAAAAGQVDTVQFLLENGANLEILDNMKWTALHHAVSSGGPDVTKLLIEKGANIHAKERFQKLNIKATIHLITKKN